MTGPVRHRRRFVVPAVATVTVTAVLIAGCYETPAEPIAIDNKSDQQILIYQIDNGGEERPIPFFVVPPRQGIVDGSECVYSDLVARLEDGTFVGTREGPFCQGDPAWVFTQDDVDQAQAP
jgi:hypothetical protein